MKSPIHDAIAKVLRTAGRPLTPRQIYDAIVERDLYAFKAQNPLGVVTSVLRGGCVELDFPSARQTKRFGQAAGGTYRLLDKPVQVPPTLYPVSDRPGDTGGPPVSVPSDRDADEQPADDAGPTHTEIQCRLLRLGADLGLSVWAPHPDRGKAWNGGCVGDMPRLLTRLPHPFAQAVARTVENIDVLWLDGDAGIVAAFEVEHTTSIYSGLLRMCDLVTLLPTVEFKLYLVAPDDRVEKFAREVVRPTFAARRKAPLYEVCRFIPYTKLLDKLEETKSVIRHLRPEFLGDIAEAHPPEAGE